MVFEQIRISGDRNFAYLIGDEDGRLAALADPGSDGQRLVARTQELGLRLAYVLITHGHADHTGASREVRRLTGARIAAFGRGDVPLRHGDVLDLGRLKLEVLHTPGHTDDSETERAAEKRQTRQTALQRHLKKRCHY